MWFDPQHGKIVLPGRRSFGVIWLKNDTLVNGVTGPQRGWCLCQSLVDIDETEFEDEIPAGCVPPIFIYREFQPDKSTTCFKCSSLKCMLVEKDSHQHIFRKRRQNRDESDEIFDHPNSTLEDVSDGYEPILQWNNDFSIIEDGTRIAFNFG